MSILLKAFIIILVIAIVVFAFAKKTVSSLDNPADFKRRRNLWFAVTSAAFLAHNYWLYAIVVSLIIILTARSENHKITLYILLLCAVPPVSERISGFGIINYLMDLSHPRLLSLFILLPAFVAIRRSQASEKGKNNINKTLVPDVLIIAFIFTSLALELRASSVTNVIRYAIYSFIDGYLPYYVASRSLKVKDDFRRVFLYFVIAVGIMSLVAVFEHFNTWSLYQPLRGSLGLDTKMFHYLMRAGELRAMASVGNSIALGYVIVITVGFMLYLKTQFENKILFYAIFAVLLAGSYSTLSRGPWVGMVVLFAFYILTGQKVVRASLKWTMIVAIIIPIMSASPWGQKFIDLLPYVGTVEEKNIEYRERLIDNANIVIRRNLWFGSETYIDEPEMQEMLQGGGIIDIVNTYAGIALRKGIVTVGLFMGFFALIILGIIRSYRSLSNEDAEMQIIGRVLSAVLVSMLFIIATVSPISVISMIYWTIAGIGAAYIRMVASIKYSRKEVGRKIISSPYMV